MKTLIKTNNSLILVSDKEIKGKCQGIEFDLLWQNPKIFDWDSDISTCPESNCKKVLSQSPKLSKEVADEIGWIDVEELDKNSDEILDFYKAFIDQVLLNRGYFLKRVERLYKNGFQKAQELNQKKYSEEDFFNFCQVICEKLPTLKKLQTSQADDYGNNLDIVLKIKDEYIQSFSQPQQWACEAEEIDGQWVVNKILKQ